MKRLAEDECIIGKVPNVDPESYEALFKEWDLNADGKITWMEFRNGMNKWDWRMVDRELLEEVINDFFAKSYKYKMQGKDQESKEMATNALRLQGSLTKTKAIEIPKAKEKQAPPRSDQFTKTVFRREGNVHPEASIGNTKIIDKSKAITFNA